jgi:hypothetical protein
VWRQWRPSWWPRQRSRVTTVHPRRARRAAAHRRGVRWLDEEEAYLWPETMSAARATQVSRSELIELYPYRSALPSGLWRELFNGAEAQIDVLVYAAVFLHEQHPDLNDVLRSKAGSGSKVRVALGDPDSGPVRARGAEERFGHGIESRCRLALMHYRESRSTSTRPRSTTRSTGSTMRCWSTRTCGRQRLQRTVDAPARLGGGLFDTYAASFEAVWQTSRPVPREGVA